MRSRTELVTTTFIDSEDDFTETDDSEEDWRPSASNRNVKKRSHNTKGRNRGSRKRKSSATSSNGTNNNQQQQQQQQPLHHYKKNRRQAAQDAIYQTFDDSDDEDDEEYEYYKARTQLAAEVEPKAIIKPPKKKEKALSVNGNTASGIFQLFLYRKDLKEDYVTNSHLCLWRKDGTNLLQKYIRIKTGVPEEFMFTSSSVYSTWDEKRRRDFVTIAVKCNEENHRRVTFVNTSDLHSLARSELERTNPGIENDDESEENENENDADADADADAEFNSDISEECEENDNNISFRPDGDDDEAEIEGDEDNVEEIEEVEDEEIQEEQDEHEDQGTEEDEEPIEEEFDDFEQLDEQDDDAEEIDENEDDEDKENQYDSENE